MPAPSGTRRLAARLTAPPTAWLILAASVGAYVVLSLLVWHEPLHVGPRRLRYYDLMVYRGAAGLVLHGRPLYAGGVGGLLPFTYPPFAALVFTPLAALPLPLDECLLTTINLIACLVVFRATFALAYRGERGTSSPDRSRAWGLVAVGVAAALWLEPITTAIGYGQIDLVLAALVLYDLSRRPGARGHGVAIGLAAGMKLTPLLFVPYLLLTGRIRAAGLAAVTFLATVAAGFILLPADAAQFWGGTGFEPARVGTVSDPADQSLHGLLARLAIPGTQTIWIVLAVAVALTGLLGAARAARRGDEATGASLCILTTLLVSPISWTHHWALAVPALLLLLLGGLRDGSRVKLAAGVLVAAVGYAYLPELAPSAVGPRDPLVLLAADPYVIVGVIALATGCLAQLRAGPAGRGRARLA